MNKKGSFFMLMAKAILVLAFLSIVFSTAFPAMQKLMGTTASASNCGGSLGGYCADSCGTEETAHELMGCEESQRCCVPNTERAKELVEEKQKFSLFLDALTQCRAKKGDRENNMCARARIYVENFISDDISRRVSFVNIGTEKTWVRYQFHSFDDEDFQEIIKGQVPFGICEDGWTNEVDRSEVFLTNDGIRYSDDGIIGRGERPFTGFRYHEGKDDVCLTHDT